MTPLGLSRYMYPLVHTYISPPPLISPYLYLCIFLTDVPLVSIRVTDASNRCEDEFRDVYKKETSTTLGQATMHRLEPGSHTLSIYPPVPNTPSYHTLSPIKRPYIGIGSSYVVTLTFSPIPSRILTPSHPLSPPSPSLTPSHPPHPQSPSYILSPPSHSLSPPSYILSPPSHSSHPPLTPLSPLSLLSLPGMSYRFRVYALNADGVEGPRSESIIVHTLVEQPAAPCVVVKSLNAVYPHPEGTHTLSTLPHTHLINTLSRPPFKYTLSTHFQIHPLSPLTLTLSTRNHPPSPPPLSTGLPPEQSASMFLTWKPRSAGMNSKAPRHVQKMLGNWAGSHEDQQGGVDIQQVFAKYDVDRSGTMDMQATATPLPPRPYHIPRS